MPPPEAGRRPRSATCISGEGDVGLFAFLSVVLASSYNYPIPKKELVLFLGYLSRNHGLPDIRCQPSSFPEGSRVQGLGLWVSGFRVLRVLGGGLRFWVWGFRVCKFRVFGFWREQGFYIIWSWWRVYSRIVPMRLSSQLMVSNLENTSPTEPTVKTHRTPLQGSLSLVRIGRSPLLVLGNYGYRSHQVET